MAMSVKELAQRHERLRELVRERMNISGPFSDEDLSVFVSAVEQESKGAHDLMREYVKALSEEGLFTAGRILFAINASVWLEIIERRKEVIKKEEENKSE